MPNRFAPVSVRFQKWANCVSWDSRRKRYLPSSFFRTYKLNRAAEFLKSGKYTVSEIADKTGFSTQSHFSVVFKKQFGVTPTEYKG